MTGESKTMYEILMPSRYDRSDTALTRSGSWEVAFSGLAHEGDAFAFARELQCLESGAYGTLAIRKEGERYPSEIMSIDCIYCDAPVSSQLVPAADDDDAWARIEREHGSSCEWANTRAHTLCAGRA